MVFSSVPVYLDPPNWQQQSNHQQQQGGGRGGVGGDHHQHHQNHHQNPQLPPQPPPPSAGGGGGSQGSIRPGSMSDRARLAKIPQPEASLKCPRCESTNTKFCYFNNYSLTQPRHFCKTCRRYWTRGGALRNVPVGGGCRRNKRSKGSRSKSPATERQTTGGSCSTTTVSSNSCTSDMIAHLSPVVPPPHLPFLPSLHHLSEYGSAGGDIGMNFAGIQPQVVSTGGNDVQYQIGGGGGAAGGSILSSGLAEQWRLQQQVQQFPFLTNLETPTGLYPFEGENVEPPSYVGGAGQLRSKPLGSSAVTDGATHQQQLGGGGAVKMEENQGLNLSRNFLGALGNDQYWAGGNAWTDLSGFTSSSTSHLL
ncbi:dof zinc finger protein DOF3.6 [Ziziphus jujuba]|uniref:Dof zinc finger protein n=2 Tax=Ziziphus jujuba TaxID=326968 RepID=A0A6P6G1I0_ZIZJJ|nr:dof zinc finger protein DOF3.6 [Ziziphus jujuba]KAH7537224.1 hypothetical protein FEM48_Zijuj03G0069900 [Ziziphus jujuba var. spinosa]